MTGKKWQFKNKGYSPEKIRETAKKYSISPVIVTILMNRSINDDEIEAYFSKSMRDIVNPMEFKDMDKAVKRILTALEKKEPIMVYGDYDVDGITSTAVMYDFLKSAGADVSYYIPERAGEGYGINIRAVNKMIKRGIKLLISVDCGITALGETSFAKLQGMDVIITDHHTCKERIPDDAVAVIDPKREDDDYPYDGLCGAGVAFKLALAVTMALGRSTNECFGRYIDLVAVGTVADVVPLRNENRIFVDRGLKALQRPKRPGIRALLEIAGASSPVTASTIGFAIAPRLNAAGRLADASVGVELMLTDDYEEALKIAKELDNANERRRNAEQEIYLQAVDMIEKDPNFSRKRIIVLHREGWHQGVIGIVASRITEKYYKPCILISDDGRGNGKGSGRSVKDFNIFDALSACERHLTGFGGHSMAAGLNVNTADIDKLSSALNLYAEQTMTEDTLTPKIEIDCPISASGINLRAAKLLGALEPFGMENEKPVFALCGANIVNASAVGSTKKHLRMKIAKDNMTFAAIGFGMGGLAEKIDEGMSADIAFQMEVNNYQGMESVQLLVKDIRKRERENP